MRVVGALLTLLIVAQPVAAQHKAPVTRKRVPAKPAIKPWQVGALLGLTAGTMLLDQRVHDALGRDTSKLPSVMVRIGDAEGNPLFVFPVLAAGTLAGWAFKSKVLQGISWEALQSTVVASVGALILKSTIGRRRPYASPGNPFLFKPFSFKDNSFPSGHTTLAFAWATSIAADTKDHLSDVFLFAGATLTAFSRINDNAHWLSDTVFGASMGIVAGRLVHRWHRAFLIAPGTVAVHISF